MPTTKNDSEKIMEITRMAAAHSFLFGNSKHGEVRILESINLLLICGDVPNNWTPDELKHLFSSLKKERTAFQGRGAVQNQTPFEYFVHHVCSHMWVDSLSSDVECCAQFEHMEFHCFDGFLTASGINAMNVFTIIQLQSERKLRRWAKKDAETLITVRRIHRKRQIFRQNNNYTCDFDAGDELILLEFDSNCVAFFCAWLIRADENVVRGCWFCKFSPWVHIFKSCKIRRGGKYCSCGVSPNVSATKLRSVS